MHNVKLFIQNGDVTTTGEYLVPGHAFLLAWMCRSQHVCLMGKGLGQSCTVQVCACVCVCVWVWVFMSLRDFSTSLR